MPSQSSPPTPESRKHQETQNPESEYEYNEHRIKVVSYLPILLFPPEFPPELSQMFPLVFLTVK